MQTEQQRVEKALELFSSGYNCAQAVTASFADEMGIDEKTALKISSSFGGGLARLREVCGAVAGMALAAGAIYGDIDPADSGSKTEHYALVQGMIEKFRDKNGSIICRDLLAAAGDAPHSQVCAVFVEDCVRILCEMMQQKQIVK